MKRKVVVLLMSVMVLAVFIFGAVAAGANDDILDDINSANDGVSEGGAFHDDGTPEVYITVLNNSGWNFFGIWMRPSSNTVWQARDRFVSNGRNTTLGNGQSITLMPSSASRHGVRFWDIRIDYGKGKRKIISNIDVFNTDEIDIGRNFRVNFQR